MGKRLTQSTAVSLKIGPFVDDTDAVTAETGLSLAQADIRISKNGGDFAQSANAAGATHDENGWYSVPLSALDVDTNGRLLVAISKGGALPVWNEYFVGEDGDSDVVVCSLTQSQAITVKIGPFLDSLDGKTAETGLTIAQSDIRISKNGGAFAQTSGTDGATHDENGFYDVPLTVADTGTLGTLVVSIQKAGAVPVWAEFMVAVRTTASGTITEDGVSDVDGDTDDLMNVWGETVTILRNTPSYGDTGVPTDSWAPVGTVLADIQPSGGMLVTVEGGQQITVTHRIFFPGGASVRQGDRIKPSVWSAGDDYYEVVMILSDEGHVEAAAIQVKGHA